MTLENKSGKKRDFKILFKVLKNNNYYVVYKDNISSNIYGGRIEDNKLLSLKDNEYDYLNKIMELIKE